MKTIVVHCVGYFLIFVVLPITLIVDVVFRDRVPVGSGVCVDRLECFTNEHVMQDDLDKPVNKLRVVVSVDGRAILATVSHRDWLGNPIGERFQEIGRASCRERVSSPV